MSAKWWNVFSTTLPLKFDFDNHPQQEYLCESLGIQQRNSSTLLEGKKKKKAKIGCVEKSKMNSFTLLASPFPQGITVQCQERPPPLVCDLTHKGKLEHASEHPASPAVCEAVKEAHFFLIPSRILR